MMTRIYAGICALLLFLGAGACAPKDSFVIEGQVEGLADGTVMTLTLGATHKDEKPLLEAVVSGGKFAFTYSVESPRLFNIGQQGAWGVLPVVVENGNRVKITGKVDYQGEGDRRMANFTEIKVTGSPLQEEYERKMAFKDELNRMYAEKEERHQAITDQVRKARAAGNQALMDSLTGTEAYAAMSADEKVFFETVGKNSYKAIMDNKDTWWGPLMMLLNLNWFSEEQKAWFAEFSPEAQKSFYGQIVYNELYPAASEGNPAPAFTVQDGNGASFNLQQLMAGKKYLLLDFWASWCGPCRKEIPNLKAVYEKFASKGLEIVSISIDKDAAAWQKALEEERLPWRNFRDETGVADAYSVSAIPAIFLVDGSGTIIATGLRGTALQEKLETLLP